MHSLQAIRDFFVALSYIIKDKCILQLDKLKKQNLMYNKNVCKKRKRRNKRK